MSGAVFATIGILADIAGAVVLAVGLFVSEKKAVELSVAGYAGSDFHENLKHPQVQDRLRQSRLAVIGLAFLIAGFLMQLVATWVK
jgi:hypothetical protein